MGNLGMWELLTVLAIALLVFGAGKLPEVGSQIGKTIKDFKKAMKDDEPPVTKKKKR